MSNTFPENISHFRNLTDICSKQNVFWCLNFLVIPKIRKFYRANGSN